MKFAGNSFSEVYAPLGGREHHLTDRERGVLGAWLGLVMGAVYGLVSTTINAVILPGVPVRVEVGDIFISVVVSGIGMAIAGFVTGWSHSSLRGMIYGALVAAGMLVVNAFLGQQGGFYQRFGLSYVLLLFFLPLAAMLLIITGLLRLGVNWLENALRERGRDRLFGLVRVWGGAVLLAAIVGSFAQMTAAEQEAVRRMHAMIQQGLTAGQPVPQPLQSVDDFRTRAASEYTLEAFTGASADTSIPGSTAEEFIIVNARFRNGLVVQCLTGQSLGQFLCSERAGP
jgi:hypothetical protein